MYFVLPPFDLNMAWRLVIDCTNCRFCRAVEPKCDDLHLSMVEGFVVWIHFTDLPFDLILQMLSKIKIGGLIKSYCSREKCSANRVSPMEWSIVVLYLSVRINDHLYLLNLVTALFKWPWLRGLRHSYENMAHNVDSFSPQIHSFKLLSPYHHSAFSTQALIPLMAGSVLLSLARAPWIPYPIIPTICMTQLKTWFVGPHDWFLNHFLSIDLMFGALFIQRPSDLNPGSDYP